MRKHSEELDEELRFVASSLVYRRGMRPCSSFFSSSSYIPESKEKEERGDLSKRIVARLSVSLSLSLSPLARSPAIFAFALIVMLSAITDESAEGGR